MNYQAHRVGGVCASVIVATSVFSGPIDNPTTYIAIGLTIVGGAVGGLLPDIDHPNSKIGRKVPPVSKLINLLCGHRGFTHTLLAVILFTYLLFILNGLLPMWAKEYMIPMSLGLIVGYSSHLLLDMLTVSGIPLLFPFTKKSVRIAKLRSGKDDFMVSIICIVITIAYFYFMRIM